MKTLLVEDSKDMRNLVARGLKRRGHEVVACVDAESGLAAFRQDAFSLVVLDWLLPGMDGLEMCRWVRAAPDGDHPLILIITARDQPEHLAAVLDAGADDYLPKPFSPALLDVRLTIAERRVVQAATQRRAAEELILRQFMAAGTAARHELNRQQRLMLDIIGHELKTPLTSISGFSELLLSRQPSPEMVRQGLEMIQQGCGRLTRLVGDILELAELEGGSVTLTRTPLDIGPQLAEWVARGDAPDRIELCVAPDLPLVLGDRGRLERAIVLLLRNSIRYAPAQGRIRLEASRAGRAVALTVSDGGAGVPPEELPHVFEAFYRTEHSRKHALPGPGLDLAIVRHIAKLHGGGIRVESSAQMGSTFTLLLPLPTDGSVARATYDTPDPSPDECPAHFGE